MQQNLKLNSQICNPSNISNVNLVNNNLINGNIGVKDGKNLQINYGKNLKCCGRLDKVLFYYLIRVSTNE